MKTLYLAAAFSLLAGAALAQHSRPAQNPQASPDPAVQALSTMVQQCSGREAQGLAQSFALQAQVQTLADQLAAEKKRADDAEAKLSKTDAPK